ncbi:hypothetical protein [Pseudooceanicola nanhaiensis]|uniref:hypothetical protein n=1 Tax=Pseudooceanicola nanhaiensis TaxID=375761 RepID=UPI003514D9BD
MAQRSLKTRGHRFLVKARRTLPPGTRVVLGIILICLGFLGFLPILGFWMIPLGAALAWLDVGPWWRGLKARRSRRAAPEDAPPE